jgi:hypothetical protein
MGGKEVFVCKFCDCFKIPPELPPKGMEQDTNFFVILLIRLQPLAC